VGIGVSLTLREGVPLIVRLSISARVLPHWNA
jgi:hypothetical protein